MADPTADSPASSEAGSAIPATENAQSMDSAALMPAEVSIRSLMEAGVHFGHQTRRWNPRMKPYLFGERNGVHIVNLDMTLPRFRNGLDFIRGAVAGGGKVLFVATKRQAQAPIRLEAERSNQYFVNNRWLGGMLTNFKTVKKSIDRYKVLIETLGDEEKSAEFSKKDLARMSRQRDKYEKSLVGIQQMTRLPQALFIIDVNCESIAVQEARRLSIPIVGVVDSNCDPTGIDFVIPGNDDSIRAIQLYCSSVANACLEGEAIYNDRIQTEKAAASEAKVEKTEKPGGRTGRVVVEIKHPPRRGRGASMVAEKREAERQAAEVEAPAAAAAPAAPAEAPAAAAAPAAEAEAPAAAAAPAAEVEAPAAAAVENKPATEEAKPSEES
jgi:small subunit ribosomal protein S2